MVKPNSEYKKAERLRRIAQGFKRFEIWLKPREWPRVQAFIKGLRK